MSHMNKFSLSSFRFTAAAAARQPKACILRTFNYLSIPHQTIVFFLLPIHVKLYENKIDRKGK